MCVCVFVRSNFNLNHCCADIFASSHYFKGRLRVNGLVLDALSWFKYNTEEPKCTLQKDLGHCMFITSHFPGM